MKKKNVASMAMAAMMAYLGYDVNLVQGYVMSEGNQHFWCEVHINGKTYVAIAYVDYERGL